MTETEIEDLTAKAQLAAARSERHMTVEVLGLLALLETARRPFDPYEDEDDYDGTDDLADAEEEIADLKDEVKDLKAAVDHLETENDRLEAELADLRAGGI